MCFKLTKKNQDEAIDVILVSLSLTYFIPFSTVSIVDFGLVNVYCEDSVQHPILSLDQRSECGNKEESKLSGEIALFNVNQLILEAQPQTNKQKKIGKHTQTIHPTNCFEWV